MIEDFKDKKLTEYLQDGQKVLIRFGHGLGDTLMFMPIFYKLRELYSSTQIDIYLECGQEEIFESVADKEGTGYDLVFSLNFPMAEGSDMSKAAKCCIEEIGIEPLTEVANLPNYDSPLVAVHFQGTALPGSVNCPEEVARQVWYEIIEAGKIPVECHFEHIFHNPANGKYEFVNRAVRDCNANLPNLIGFIQRCYAFVGVASGPFVVALSVLPNQRIMYLEKYHRLETYTNLPITKCNVFNYKNNRIKEWLINMT